MLLQLMTHFLHSDVVPCRFLTDSCIDILTRGFDVFALSDPMQNEIALQPVSGERRGALDELLLFVLQHLRRNATLPMSLHQLCLNPPPSVFHQRGPLL